MTKTPLAIFALLAATSCTDESNARRVLEQAGYTDVTFTGLAFDCGSDEVYATGFRGKSPTRTTVAGAVCCGWFKSCVVRIR